MAVTKTKCFITIDTECLRAGWPWTPGRQPLGYDRCMLAKADDGREYGVRYIMSTLEEHGLVGEFFVEPFCSYKLGLAPLRDICREICARGHAVSLHLHPGWKSGMTDPPIRHSDMMCDYDVDGQVALLREGLDILAKCDVPASAVFRAGNLGGNRNTYEALRRLGIRISSNYCVGWASYMPERYGLAPSVNDIVDCDGVWELPLTSFHDFPRLRPSHLRPLQIAACSNSEMKKAIECVGATQTQALVILLHSFELIRAHGDAWLPDPKHIRRFHSMCAVLAANSDRIETSRFADLTPLELEAMCNRATTVASKFPAGTDFTGAARWLSHGFAHLTRKNNKALGW